MSYDTSLLDKVGIYLPLDDIGLFKKPRKHEAKSQYQRACEVRDAFAHCMQGALHSHYCCMPELCAMDDKSLSCAHLTVDYRNFTGSGTPLTGNARRLIDARLKAIGTLVARRTSTLTGPLPGDIYIPELKRISTFPAHAKRRPKVKSGAAVAAAAPVKKRSGFWGLFG